MSRGLYLIEVSRVTVSCILPGVLAALLHPLAPCRTGFSLTLRWGQCGAGSGRPMAAFGKLRNQVFRKLLHSAARQLRGKGERRRQVRDDAFDGVGAVRHAEVERSRS